MKMIKNIIEYLIAISVVPAIMLTVIHVTELKDVRNVQFELLAEEDGIFNVTPGTFSKLRENRRIKNYVIESNYPLITQEEMEKLTWQVGDIKNEIYIDENGQKRMIERVGQVTFDGSENWTDKLRGEMITRFTLSKNHPIYNNYTNNYIVSNDLYLIVSNIDFSLNEFQIAFHENGNIYIGIPNNILGTLSINDYLSQYPLTVTYELKVKNPKTTTITKVWKTPSFVYIYKPIDFIGYGNNDRYIEGTLSISGITGTIEFVTHIVDDKIHMYSPDYTLDELSELLIGKTLIYKLVQPRLVEEYDFSEFRLVFHKNRIRVLFDIDDGHYLWEITNDDKMIPLNGQYDLGNIWTVKFYDYEIQQPLIRKIVLLIPLIVISGILIYMFNIIKKKGFS